MRVREYLALWSRSALGLGSLVLSIAAGIAAGFGLAAAGSHFIAAASGFLAALGSLCLLFFIGLATGLGSRAAFGEAGRKEAERAGKALADFASDRQRLAALRLGDEAVAAARDLVALQAGRFLDAARLSQAAWDPKAGAALGEALGLIDAWLREADETSIEKRFALPDAHPFPEARERVVALLKAKAGELAVCIDSLPGAIPAPDTVSIEEEER